MTRSLPASALLRGLAGLSLGLVCLASPPAAAESGARSVIARTVDEVIAVLDDPSLDTRGRRERIEEIARDRFDFRTMSKLVLARNWKRFSREQQQAFVEEFQNLLSRSYGDRIERYEQQRVEILGERAEQRGDVSVLTRILGGDLEGFKVDYRLRQREGDWYIIDVKIEGVSLVSNYRDQFKEVLGRGGPDDLLARMRKKNVGPPSES